MADGPYPIDIRVDRPQTSSRMWAILTILLIKFLALIPQFICLIFLQIALFFVFLAAQVMVAIKGEYPPAMFDFVVGVLRWSVRVQAFVFNVSDACPPFSLREDPGYGVDLLAERPPRSSRLYALLNLIVFLALVLALVAFIRFLGHFLASHTSSGGTPRSSAYNVNLLGQSGSLADITLRGIAVIPHTFVLIFVGLVAGVLWLVVQWVILFTGRFPQGMYDIVAGFLRWSTRVSAYKFGLTDRYPPFTIQPSLATPGGGMSAAEPPGWPLPPEPVPPAPPAPPAAPAAGYQPAPPPLQPPPQAPAPASPPSAAWPPDSQP